MGYLNYVRQIQVKVHKRPKLLLPGHRAMVLKLTVIQQPVKHGLISPLILWPVKKEPRYFSPMLPSLYPSPPDDNDKKNINGLTSIPILQTPLAEDFSCSFLRPQMAALYQNETTICTHSDLNRSIIFRTLRLEVPRLRAPFSSLWYVSCLKLKRWRRRQWRNQSCS